MGLFGRKRNSETIDFTEMQRRDLLPAPRVSEKRDDSEVKDLSSGSENSLGDNFLSSLAGAGVSSSVGSTGSVTDNLSEARKRGKLSAQLNEMKIKLEDTEFKMNCMADKIRELEEKLRALQKY